MPAFCPVISLCKQLQTQLFHPPPSNFCSCHVCLGCQGHPSCFCHVVWVSDWHSVLFFLSSYQHASIIHFIVCLKCRFLLSVLLHKELVPPSRAAPSLTKCPGAVPPAAAVPQPGSSTSLTHKKRNFLPRLGPSYTLQILRQALPTPGLMKHGHCAAGWNSDSWRKS